MLAREPGGLLRPGGLVGQLDYFADAGDWLRDGDIELLIA